MRAVVALGVWGLEESVTGAVLEAGVGEVEVGEVGVEVIVGMEEVYQDLK